MNKAFTTTALAIAASVSTTLYAQSTDTTELDPIIVSGGISPISADEFGRSNTIITREQIENRGYSTVQQALEAQPGISINGASSNNRNIRIRGGEANHVLVLVDGARVAAGNTAGYTLKSINTSTVERIEVLRGPQSVPFGTDASTGVINIITREARSGREYGIAAEYGEGDKESFYLTQSDRRSNFSLTVSNFYDEGYDFSGDGGEKDSTSIETITSKGESVFKNLSIGYTARLADIDKDFDDQSPGEVPESNYIVDDTTKSEKILERLGSVRLGSSHLEDTISQRLRVEESVNQSDSTDDQKTLLSNYRVQLAADKKSIDFSDRLISVLFERKTDSEDASSDERENDSAAIEFNGFFDDGLSLQAGARYDRSDQFANTRTWNVAVSKDFNRTFRLRGSVGEAAVYPSFFEVFGGEFPILDWTYLENNELDPERNFGYDLGVELQSPNGLSSLSITYFNEALEDEIVTVDIRESGGTTFKQAQNSGGTSDRQGVELAGSLTATDRLELSGRYTFIDSTSEDGTVEGRRPAHELGVAAVYALPNDRASFSADLRHVQGLEDQQFFVEDDPFEELPSFTTVDLSVQALVASGVEITARIDNVFDADDKEVWGYATRGRAGFVGLRASW